MFEELTARQEKILDFIKHFISQKGYPPSVREIGKAVGLNSSSTVHSHLSQLENKGYIRKDPTKPRTIELLLDSNNADIAITEEVVNVPLVGSITAGEPILAEENIESYIPLPVSLTGNDSIFILKIKGESMINAGIIDGDNVIVKKQSIASNGDIVVALIDDEATVKRFYKEDGYIRLQPENEVMDPIIVNDVKILGKVTGVFRKIN